MNAAQPAADRPTRIETADPGVFVDLDAMSRDAAIQELAASDTAPIAQADELVASITGTSLKMIVAARVRLFLDGHTPEADEYLPIALLVHEAQQHAGQARAHIGTDDRDRDLVAAEASLATTAAFCMAAIDRLRQARGAS